MLGNWKESQTTLIYCNSLSTNPLYPTRWLWLHWISLTRGLWLSRYRNGWVFWKDIWLVYLLVVNPLPFKKSWRNNVSTYPCKLVLKSSILIRFACFLYSSLLLLQSYIDYIYDIDFLPLASNIRISTIQRTRINGSIHRSENPQ